ncbi:MAG: S-methyl-5-thioribose-1-phosphate isomerase [Candidatus Heimdallarchaeota archaeon]|nr:S-methyl-5-thioribose-1-phosphate isomerase [Candidatus Heimdallarchaeota archaeon]MCK4876536.1 S-methyl-5-thioribose-1-phosphate isomerase [Candidatus Heimdallarchaeota archaeon]
MKIKVLGLEEIRSVDWNVEKECIQLIDQRLIPFDFKINEYNTTKDVCKAIQTMVVRGAPAIGATAAYGIVVALKEVENYEVSDKRLKLDEKLKQLLATRPTAVDLANFALETYQTAIKTNFSIEETLLKAEFLADEMVKECTQIGIYGEELINDGDTVLTHCNAGPMATIDHGTALAPIFRANEQGKNVKVLVDETRPRLQGAKITAWELEQEGIEHNIISDSAAAFLMSRGKVNKVILGADRCLKDGTISNKIGTLSLAVNANYFGIPFYSAFPWSTLDKESKSMEEFEIEYRDEDEVKYVSNIEDRILIANPTSKALNPAFDITPAKLITGYITSDGILTKEDLEKK